MTSDLANSTQLIPVSQCSMLHVKIFSRVSTACKAINLQHLESKAD
jgi:hypothetical protein